MKFTRLFLPNAISTLAVVLTGCTYAFNVGGIEPTAADNPNVLVTAQDEAVHFSRGGSIFTSVEYVLRPSLSVSFERALEKYVDRGSFVIKSAKLYPPSFGEETFAMVVYTNQQRYVLETDVKKGRTGSFIQDFPSFLDACARQLAVQLKSSAMENKTFGPRPR